MRRRTTQVFSLAFLDCICCGFGAIILIFVLSLAGEDQMSHVNVERIMRLMELLAKEMAETGASRENLERDNARIASMLSDARMRNDALHSLLDDMERKVANEKSGQGALLVDMDELQKEIAARQRKREMVLPDTVKPLPVGIPVGSNHVAFVIDTSGSMRDTYGRLYPLIVRKIEEVLDVYPIVQGIQVLDADGRPLIGMPGGGSTWFRDEPAVRDRIKRAIRANDNDSRSNPVPGLVAVFTRLMREERPDMKVGIYIFGDEFDGTSAPVIARIDQLNPRDANGNRKAVINAIAFPTMLREGSLSQDNTMLKYANLMREITYAHGGAFIALSDNLDTSLIMRLGARPEQKRQPEDGALTGNRTRL